MASIDFKNVSKSFRETSRNTFFDYLNLRLRREKPRQQILLRDCNFSLSEPGVYYLRGLNGSGKTTLLRLISGILEPDSGHVQVRGRVLPLLHPRISFHPQLNLERTYKLLLELYGIDVLDGMQAIRAMLNSWGLPDLMHAKFRYLSPGQCALAFLAVGKVICPDILLIDELLSHCDAGALARWEEEFQSIKDRGACVIVVSHQMDQSRNCDGTLFIEDQQVQWKARDC